VARKCLPCSRWRPLVFSTYRLSAAGRPRLTPLRQQSANGDKLALNELGQRPAACRNYEAARGVISP
jgi:hypothetical protein